ncbi:MAG: serine hydrolase, partial [Anaerolineae bacterium]
VYVTERVMRPLGMERSTFNTDELFADADHLVPHRRGENRPEPTPFPYPNPNEVGDFAFLAAAGGISSSVNEMTHYLNMLIDQGRYAGGDMVMLDRRAIHANIELFRGLTGERKNFVAQARMVGFVFIFKFLFRMMDIYEAAERAGKALNIDGRVLDYPRAEVAMDVDKLHQYLLVKNELEASLA